MLDESALTGEPLPVTTRRQPCAAAPPTPATPFELRALAARPRRAPTPRSCGWCAQAEARARAVRAAWPTATPRLFLPLTLRRRGRRLGGLAAIPVRALAVFVVATPCPLILAAPIALVAGVSRAARRGVIVKGGARSSGSAARAVLLDKTGTLTLGRPAVERVVALDGLGPTSSLRLAASLDQLSAHAVAEALVARRRQRGLALDAPGATSRRSRAGRRGTRRRPRVAVGSAAWLRGARRRAAALPAGLDGDAQGRSSASTVGWPARRDRRPRCAPDAARARAARCAPPASATSRCVTGDRADVAEAVGERLGVDRVYAEQTPEDKLEVVRALRARPGLRRS